MKASLQIGLGLCLAVTLCVATYADNASHPFTPPFDASFQDLEPATISSPVALRKTDFQLAKILSEVPQLQLNTHGPRSFVIHEASAYQVELKNLGGKKANAIQVKCPIPSWVEIASSRVAIGDVTQKNGFLVWTIPELNVGAAQRMSITLIPKEGREFDLPFSVTAQAVTANRLVVQQPVLELKLESPAELSSSSATLFNLTASNSGTGTLKGVQLELFAAEHHLQTKVIPQIPAGESRLIPIEVTARQAGEQELRVVASTTNRADKTSPKLHSSLASTNAETEAEVRTRFLVKRGELQLVLAGNRIGYAGQLSKFTVKLKNIGNASVKNVLLSLNIPVGMQYSRGIRAANATEGGISWVVSQVGVDQELTFPVELIADRDGRHEVHVTANSVNQLSARTSFFLETRSVPDLRLTVLDPVGPQGLDGPIDYEIQVQNRGTGIAQNISVSAIVGDVCEIIDVSGTAAIKGNRIHFKPTAELPPNRKLVLKVRVQPSKIGSHEFRALLKSTVPSARLAAQESTSVVDRSAGRPTISESMARRDLFDLSNSVRRREPTLARPPGSNASTLR